SVEISSGDGVGNVSPSATGTVTVFAASGSIDPYSSPDESPDTVRSLSDAQTAQAIQIAQSSPAVAAVTGGRATTASDAMAWTTAGGSVFGAELTLNWTDPIAVSNVTVPTISFDSTGAYT